MNNSEYVIVHDVPILDEHDITDDDGEVITTLDEQKLRMIAARNNKRMRETGDLSPIIIGHTKDEADEQEQPEIVGYAKDLKVKPFKKTGRKAIHATFAILKRCLNKVRKFPRRSVELWLSDWKIDPIALLGATTPERDLGLLQLSRDGRKKYRRTLTEEKDSMDKNAIVEAVLAALQETDVWKFMEQQMEEAQDAGENGMEGSPDDLPPEAADALPDEVADEDEEGDEDGGTADALTGGGPDEVSVKRSASAPGGSNTCCPGMADVGKKKMSRNAGSDRIRLARLERANRGLQDAYNDLRLKYQRAEREKDLIQLEAEGYDIDRVEELDFLAPLEDADYQKQLSRIRKRYSRAPVGPARFDLGATRSAAPRIMSQGRDRDQAAQIANYASRKGISYEDALTELEGE